MIRLGTILLVVLTVVTGCTEAEKPAARPATPTATPEARPVEAPVRTDRTRYALQEGRFGPEVTIVTTFHAPADRPVYIRNCNGALSLGLQRLKGGTWVDAWAAETNGCASAPIVIQPAGTHVQTITAASGVDAVVSSRRTERKLGPGTYRAVWYGVLTSPDGRPPAFGEELPLAQRVSAPFAIDALPPAAPSLTSPATRHAP